MTEKPRLLAQPYRSEIGLLSPAPPREPSKYYRARDLKTRGIQDLTSSVLNSRSPEVWRKVAGENEFLVSPTDCSPEVERESPPLFGFFARLAGPRESWPQRHWRREWDSNPRYGFPHTRFPSVRLKPLGHLSRCPLLKARRRFGKRGRSSRSEKYRSEAMRIFSAAE